MASRTTANGHIVQPVVVIGSDGTQLETRLPPGSDYVPPSLELRLDNTTRIRLPIPLTARHHWTLHPNGHFLTGVSSDYRVDLGLDHGVLRIERAVEPVAVSVAERNHHREDMVRGMRASQPDWRWDGPPIPKTRPRFRGLSAGRDGRIWVTVSTQTRSVENEGYNSQNPNSNPVSWRSPLRYDVFEPDGTYLGAVVPPEGFASTPRPIFDGEYVWAVTKDELGVERVVRYRIEVGGC